ncbi:flagella synthesis protein FlgN [Alloalcanivorax sp. C16-1]|uniref:flagella synthesis protein FlgN n=1 Tax=Alloalcanivorax sp. C16-1 TaxID=3390051 RepID=UPI003970CACC
MSLAARLRDHRARLDDLVALLDQERRLLAAGRVDGEQLARVAARKGERLAELERFEQQRRQVQQRLGYPDDQDGDQRAAADAGCAALWHGILDTARRAARLNRDNGTVIGVRMEHNQRLLNVLQEQAGQRLYGPDGQARGNRRRLDQRA